MRPPFCQHSIDMQRPGLGPSKAACPALELIGSAGCLASHFLSRRGRPSHDAGGPPFGLVPDGASRPRTRSNLAKLFSCCLFYLCSSFRTAFINPDIPGCSPCLISCVSFSFNTPSHSLFDVELQSWSSSSSAHQNHGRRAWDRAPVQGASSAVRHYR